MNTKRGPGIKDLLILFLILLIITIIVNSPIHSNLDGFDEKVNMVILTKSLIINEVSVYPTEAVEIKNISGADIDLTDYYLCDKNDHKYNLTGVIPNGGIIAIDNKKLGYNINNNNETFYIKEKDKIIDTFVVDKLKENISVGITNNERVYYKSPTIGKENSQDYYLGFSDVPLFSINGGYANSGDQVFLSVTDDSKIYYTLDGSFPTSASLLYTSPITITKNTVITAISYKNGYIESDYVSRTFIVGRKHDIAFVSLSGKQDDLNGLVTNYLDRTLESKVKFEFYEADGKYGTSFTGDVKISGNASRRRSQKSFSVYLRKKYSTNSVRYPFFDNKLQSYSSLLLWNGGNISGIKMRDAVLTQILKGQMDIDMRDSRPVAVYINGEYYGLEYLREKSNADFIESKFGVDKDNIDLFKKTTLIKGNLNAYNQILSYVQTNNPTDKKAYEYVKSQVDIQELINFWIAEFYYNNLDFRGLNNFSFWKAKDGKWRWLIYDLDYGFYNIMSTSDLTNLFLTSTGGVVTGGIFDIMVFLSQNSEFKDLYYTTLGNHLRTTFKPDRVDSIIDKMMVEIKTEMSYEISKWNDPASMDAWTTAISNLKNSSKIRYDSVVAGLKTTFSSSDYNKYFGGL